ncbi:MAG: sulfite exporter TauE/SafE family protein [Pseudomonadota bacterium]
MDIFAIIGNLPAYLLTGAVAGIMAGMLGVGGGLVIVPVLVWLFRQQGMDESLVMHLAVGSSLATIIVTSIGAIQAHQRRGAVLWRQVRVLTPGILLGALAGAAVAEQLPTLWLQRLFAIFIIIVGLRMAMNAQVNAQRVMPGAAISMLVGGIIGAVSAIVGIGGGSLTVPWLSRHRVPLVNAVATSSACGLPIAVAGALGFALTGWGKAALPEMSTGYLYWPAIGGIVVSSYLLTPLGARAAHRLPVASLRRLFAALLLVIGIRLLF